MTLFDNSSLYDILDINLNASPQDVREGYFRAKATFNRDSIALYTIITKEERAEALKKIEEAYLILSNPIKRKEYDQNYELMHLQNSNNSEESNPFSASLNPVQLLQDQLTHDKTSHELNNYSGEIAKSSPPLALVDSYSPTTETEDDFFFNSLAISPSKELAIPSLNIAQPLSSSDLPAEVNSELANLMEEINQETEWSGGFLKRIRITKGLSIEELAGLTKITKNYIVAIEEENYSKLPAPVYIRGFVYQIARALMLPYEKVATAYLARYHKQLSSK